MPTSSQAGVDSSAMHYLRAVAAVQGKDGPQVMARMRATPVDDPLFGPGYIRPDGRAVRPMYLFEVEKPAESSGAWDIYKVLETIPGD